MKTRIYFLDHLRTFAIFLVVLIHAGIVYEHILENIWIVSDDDKSGSIGLVRMYADLFVMYLIFFVSGFFIPKSISRKSSSEFIISKCKRILLPWLIAVLTLIPAYKIIFLYSRGLAQEAWYTYFHIFQRSGTDLGFFSNNPSQNWLWFLPILFLFQILYLGFTKINLFPLKISIKTAVIATFVIGIIYSMIISNAGHTGWLHSGFFEFQKERLLPYFMVFIVGAICQEQGVLEKAKNTKYYIVSNVVLTLSLGVFTAVALNLFFNLVTPDRNYFLISDLADRTIYYITALLSMFSFLYVIIHVFKFNFNKTNRLMNLLNKNSYSVYIIHVIVLGVIALLFQNISLPAFAKYLILTVLTFIVSNLLIFAYEHLIQKNLYLKIAGLSLFTVAFFSFINVNNQDSSVSKFQQTEKVIPEVGLHEAVIRGDIEAINQHIKAGSDLNAIEPTGGSTALITVSVFGKTEIAKLLIDNGADLNLQNNEGSTALLSAAFFGNVEIVEYLIANGANQQIKNNSGSTPLDAVSGSFEELRGVYDYFQSSLGPLGLKLDFETLESRRDLIKMMLSQ
jgi:peptidoglycan/LPS O-acetylase OafA/YrhL